MSACSALRAGGGRCKATAMDGYEFCFGHSPDHAEQRRRNASRGGKLGGRGRPQTETNDIKTEIRAVIGGVLSEKIPQGRGAVALQGFGVLLRAHEQERREEVGGSLSHEEFSKLTEQVVGVVGQHLHGPALRAFVEDVGKILDASA
jgi:hypothetical protein